MKVRTVHQSNLSSECLMVQIWGLEFCKTCEYRDSKKCGGKKIRLTETNALGKKVPVE